MSSKKFVYIVLTSTTTYLSQAIKFFTNERLCHVSMAFDHELKEVYSFGRKDQRNPFIGGFVQENLNGPVFRDAYCAIYKIPVNIDSYLLMRKRIYHFHTHAYLYRYNFLGMIPTMFNIEWTRKNHYFCSQFVNDILEYGNIHLFRKSSVLITPADFIHCGLAKVYEGMLSNYLKNEELKCELHLEANINNNLELVR